MPNAFVWLVLVPLLWVFTPAVPKYRAWIALETKDSLLKIQAFCWSSQEGPLQYRLEVTKDGGGGRSISVQSGTACVREREEKLLSQVRVRIVSPDRYTVQLEVFRQGEKVGGDWATYPPEMERLTFDVSFLPRASKEL
jgi:hypothetical protein